MPGPNHKGRRGRARTLPARALASSSPSRSESTAPSSQVRPPEGRCFAELVDAHRRVVPLLSAGLRTTGRSTAPPRDLEIPPAQKRGSLADPGCPRIRSDLDFFEHPSSGVSEQRWEFVSGTCTSSSDGDGGQFVLATRMPRRSERICRGRRRSRVARPTDQAESRRSARRERRLSRLRNLGDHPSGDVFQNPGLQISIVRQRATCPDSPITFAERLGVRIRATPCPSRGRRAL
jgi:hypothetical protein